MENFEEMLSDSKRKYTCKTNKDSEVRPQKPGSCNKPALRTTSALVFFHLKKTNSSVLLRMSRPSVTLEVREVVFSKSLIDS